jgi:hypothetical protein
LPYYVKPGFAIRIIHKGGQKGFQEISGPGRAVPSPVMGAVFPPPPPLFDGILSGIAPTAPGGGMYITLTNGQFRIDGVVYSFDIGDGGVLMSDDGLIMDPVTGMPMGAGTNATLLFDAAPAIPSARYDLVVVAADGLAHIVKGTASTNPVMPSIPADHIRLFHVLILGGKTEIIQTNINAEWETRTLHDFSFLLTGTYAGTDQMYCSLTDANPVVNVVITLLCQYGWSLSMTYDISLVKDYGTGTIGTNSNGPWDPAGPISKSGTGSQVTFYYRRDEVLYDPAPPGGPLSIDEQGEGSPAAIYLRPALTAYIGVSRLYNINLLFTTPP